MLIFIKAVRHVIKKDITTYEWNDGVYLSHMFLKDKYMSSGDFERIKARLVVSGDYVDPGSVGEVSSPTVNPITVMMMINIAAVEGMELSCHDIKWAFLIPEIDSVHEAMYIRIDPAVVEQMVAVRPSWQRYVDDKGRIYLRLQKYLYGLPQASYQFNQFMDHRLKCMGFKAQAGDPCSFF